MYNTNMSVFVILHNILKYCCDLGVMALESSSKKVSSNDI